MDLIDCLPSQFEFISGTTIPIPEYALSWLGSSCKTKAIAETYTRQSEHLRL